ncbi:RNA polymerase sigma factor [Parapedobacter sp. 10938]|uniref:RNA polymerase sigma factor n=1 Tax=Parapedobacter flavus TaxID=3110225 RepID=UPI002DBAA963|nr:RNA polymerase sigma factor [Parapedobacter sp. 10938]MEC3880903.1 RNA polymerase sigma factor [Parapedobacter sp. 10938]
MTDEKQRSVTAAIAAYGKGLLGFIRKRVKNDADAEDILQDVWYRLSAVINSHPVEQVGGWLYRVAINRIVDKRRKKSESLWESGTPEGAEQTMPTAMPAAVDGDPEAKYQERAVWERLYAALEELPAAQRDVFVWHELEQIPFAEIAALTGEPVGKLVSRKHYAVLHLRKRLKVFYDELTD